jgi:hypothetical protein
MANEQFFLNDDCLRDFLDEQALNAGLNNLVLILRELTERDIARVMAVNYWDLPLPFDKLMYQLLYEIDSYPAVSPDIRRELMMHLDRFEIVETAATEVTIGSADIQQTFTSGVFRVAKERYQSSDSFPLFACLSKKIEGNATYNLDEVDIHCHFISRKEDLPGYYQALLGWLFPKISNFTETAKHAFPLLELHPDLKLETLGINLQLHFPKVLQHLVFLNNEYAKLGEMAKWDLPKLMQEARARGIDFSDESPNTKRDAKKMRSRLCSFTTKGKEYSISCSLHTKILPTEGRIHFHNPHPDFENKVLIGIFDKHLPV